jgi:hypothetical protein
MEQTVSLGIFRPPDKPEPGFYLIQISLRDEERRLVRECESTCYRFAGDEPSACPLSWLQSPLMEIRD